MARAQVRRCGLIRAKLFAHRKPGVGGVSMFRYLSRVALIAAAWDDRVDRRRQRDVIAWLQVERRHCQPVERDQLLPRVGLGKATAHAR